MKIAILHADHYSDFLGGGELTTKYWYEQGLKEGLDITWIHNKNLDTSLEFDFYLLGNWSRFTKQDYIWQIMESKSFAILQHNSVNLERLNLSLYHKAKFAVTLAPNHAQKFGLPINNTYITAPFVDYKLFKPHIKKRKDISLYIGTIAPHKIGQSMINRIESTPDREYHFYGEGQPFFNYPNVKFFPAVENDKIPELMSEYKTFFWHLDRYGCYGRTIIEALLCEMELDVNREAFGLFLFPWIDSGRQGIIDALENDKTRFWSDILDNILQTIE